MLLFFNRTLQKSTIITEIGLFIPPFVREDNEIEMQEIIFCWTEQLFN